MVGLTKPDHGLKTMWNGQLNKNTIKQEGYLSCFILPEKFIEKSKKPESPLLFEILAFSFSTKWVPPSLILAVQYFRTKH